VTVDSAGSEDRRHRHPKLSITLNDLLQAGLLSEDQLLVGSRGSVNYEATLAADGRIRLNDGSLCRSPSAAGVAVLKRQSCNGWDFWQVEGPAGLETLSQLRSRFLGT
jgi:hypothetical protein